MIVTALICWYDESEDDLTACVESLAGLADRIVALDGAYELTGAISPNSPESQVEAIKAASEHAEIECEVYAPSEHWPGQIVKRQKLFDLASGSDWFLIVDADCVFHGSKIEFRSQIEDGTALAWEASEFTPIPEDVELCDVAATKWHEWLAGRIVPYRCALRALDDIKIELHHWWYSGLYNGERVALFGWDNSGGDLEGAGRYPPCEVGKTDLIWVEHRCLFRSKERIDRQRNLYSARAVVVREHGEEP